MKKCLWAIDLVLVAISGGSFASASGNPVFPADTPDDTSAMVVLGEEDLADRAEILRNMYRRITPPGLPLVQDAGMWPAAWEEFGADWGSAAAEREFGTWVVPVEVAQDAGATVVRDGTGTVLWRGWTDFARTEAADVVLTGGLVGEKEWEGYEGVRDAVIRVGTAGGPPALPVRTGATNGLRFTAHEWTTNDTFRLELAYETDTDVDIFAYAVAHTSAWVVATWTNDENVAVTDTNLVWYPAGPPFNGMESDWEQRATVGIDSGVGEFEDSGFSEAFGRVRFYAAAVAQDSDGDGLNDGFEVFVSHTDSTNQDSDGDGLHDGLEVFVTHTDPNNSDSDHDGIGDATELAAGTSPTMSNVWWMTTTTNAIHEWVGLGTNIPIEPKCITNYWIVATNRPTTNSVVCDVKVSGYVDDILCVDGNVVGGWNRGPTNFTALSVLAQTTNAQSGRLDLELWDWPDEGHSGENEVKLGTSCECPFRVEWEWWVPMDFRLEHVNTNGYPQVVNPSGSRTNREFSCQATVLPTNIPDSAVCWSCTNSGMSFVGGVTNGRTVQLVGTQTGEWEASVTVEDSTLPTVVLHGAVLEKKKVMVYLHIVRDDNGENAATMVEQFQSLLNGANQIWEQAAVEFKLATNVVYIDKMEWLDISVANEWAEYKQLQSTNMNTGGVEVYCVNQIDGGPALSYKVGGPEDGTTIGNNATALTLAHELGHAFGLDDIYLFWPHEDPTVFLPSLPVKSDWEPLDWCDEMEDGGYGRLSQPGLVLRLLMLGDTWNSAVDIPEGPIHGIDYNGHSRLIPVGIWDMGDRQPEHW